MSRLQKDSGLLSELARNFLAFWMGCLVLGQVKAHMQSRSKVEKVETEEAHKGENEETRPLLGYDAL